MALSFLCSAPYYRMLNTWNSYVTNVSIIYSLSLMVTEMVLYDVANPKVPKMYLI